MGIVRCPDLFEIIEFPDFRAEQVDDDIPGIDQHPICIRHTFDTGRATGQFLYVLCKMVCESRNMPAGTTGCDDHEICERRSSIKVNEENVFSLVILKGLGEGFGHITDFFERGLLGGLEPRGAGGQGSGSFLLRPLQIIASTGPNNQPLKVCRRHIESQFAPNCTLCAVCQIFAACSGHIPTSFLLLME